MNADLSPAQLDAIFESQVRPIYAEALSQRAAQPTVTFVGGQPGAGKSTAIKTVQERRGAILLDTDALRAFDPRYKQLMTTDPFQAIETSNVTARKLLVRLKRAAISSGVNIVFETALRNPEAFKTVLTEFRPTHGIEIIVIAPRPEVARARLMARKEMEIEKFGTGRIVTLEATQAAESGMLRILNDLPASQQVTVVTSDGRAVAQGNGTETAAAIVTDRARPLNQKEANELSDTWDIVTDKMRRRDASPAEFAELEGFSQIRDDHAQPEASTIEARQIEAEQMRLTDQYSEGVNVYLRANQNRMEKLVSKLENVLRRETERLDSLKEHKPGIFSGTKLRTQWTEDIEKTGSRISGLRGRLQRLITIEGRIEELSEDEFRRNHPALAKGRDAEIREQRNVSKEKTRERDQSQSRVADYQGRELAK